MARPLINEQTAEQLLRLASSLPHAIGLVGDEGTGLTTIAAHLSELAGASTQYMYPEKKDVVDLVDGTITIAIVRRLYRLTQGRSHERRCIVITAADTMSHEAQNAFLKLLEEPTDNTTFILLIHHPDRLLPTVRSRLQLQQIRRLSGVQSMQLFDRLGVTDEIKRRQLLFLASGLPARLTQLVRDQAQFETEATRLRHARTLIQGSKYERLLVAHSVKSDRQDARSIIDYAMTILRYDISSKKTVSPTTLTLLSELERAAHRLLVNGNPRLVVAQVALTS